MRFKEIPLDGYVFHDTKNLRFSLIFLVFSKAIGKLPGSFYNDLRVT